MGVERWGSERRITKRLLVAGDVVLRAAMSVRRFALLSSPRAFCLVSILPFCLA